MLSQHDGWFMDTEFLPQKESIFKTKTFPKPVVWKRPQDLSERPRLISHGTSRHDMKQGQLNDCWFLSTLSAIAEKSQLMNKILPSHNYTFGTAEYTGIIHCRFWQFGSWVDVLIDDLLPSVDGDILFAHSSDPNEFWVSLVEKAYAKLNKSYEALEFGFEADAFTDLTGGLAEWYNPADLQDKDFYLIRAAFQNGAIIGCLSMDRHGRQEKDKKGMVPNHSYVITGVEEVPYRHQSARLVRVRNPWGDTEWQGAWSDGSEDWDYVPDVIKEELELTSKDDGEFWMSFDDFRRQYCNMIICNLAPDFDHDGISDKAECQIMTRDEWQQDFNAGGWLECDSFYKNPQYLISLHPDASVQRRYNGRLPLIVSLMQIYRRYQKLEGEELYAIGFEIFQLTESLETLAGKMFFDTTDPLMPENEETYAEYRETSGRFFLDPGHYLLVPSTQIPGKSREYILRLYSVSHMEYRCLGNCFNTSTT